MNVSLGARRVECVSGFVVHFRRRLAWYVVPLLVLLGGCRGPQALHVAIDPRDEDSYTQWLNAYNGDARAAYTKWMAEEQAVSEKAIEEADAELSATRNPFDAHRDRQAVSRGGVIYKIHCARCHGIDARGRGASTVSAYPSTNFKTLGKRIAATLHRGAPRKWFRVIRKGSGDLVDYPDGRTFAMPSFETKLTRQQTWLVISYLQSLDMHACERRDHDRSLEGR